MAILNPDGTVYQVGRGRDAVDDNGQPVKPVDLISDYDSQIIRRSGQPIWYYKVYISSTDIDPVYLEIMDKVRAIKGVQLWAFFEPEKPLQELSVFGIDGPETRVFRVNRKDWYETVKEDPLPSSLIYVKWDRTWWQLTQANHTDYMNWGKYGIELVASKRQIGRGEVRANRPPGDVDKNYGHPNVLPTLDGRNQKQDYPVI